MSGGRGADFRAVDAPPEVLVATIERHIKTGLEPVRHTVGPLGNLIECFIGAHAAGAAERVVVAVERQDTETARREFEKALEVNPDDLNSLLDLGILYQKTGDNKQALHYLQLFLSKVPRGQFADQIPAVREAIQELKSP